jgi:hypothetical protein
VKEVIFSRVNGFPQLLFDNKFLEFKASNTGVPELAPQRKQACADNKRDFKLTKINFLLAQITEL